MNVIHCSNAKMHKCSNAQMFKCTNVQMHKCSNTQMHERSNAQMHKCSNVQMFKCSNVRTIKCSNAEMFKCTNVQMLKCTNDQMLKYSNAQMCKCSNAQMHKCSNVGCDSLLLLLQPQASFLQGWPRCCKPSKRQKITLTTLEIFSTIRRCSKTQNKFNKVLDIFHLHRCSQESLDSHPLLENTGPGVCNTSFKL